MFGCRINGSPDPPAIFQVPWWPITLVFKANGNGGFSPFNIYQRLIEQIPSFKTPDHLVVLRFHSVRAWRRSQPIMLKVNSLYSDRMYQQLYDVPTQRNFAHVGWRYSDAEREISFRGSDSTRWLFQIFGDVNQPYPLTLYVRCSIQLQVDEVEYNLHQEDLEEEED